MRLHQGDCLAIERKEDIAAQPLPFVGDNSISKVPACIVRSQAEFDCWTIHHHIRCAV